MDEQEKLTDKEIAGYKLTTPRLQPLRCWFGFHKWSIWGESTPQGILFIYTGQAVQSRLCMSCGLGQSKLTHHV